MRVRQITLVAVTALLFMGSCTSTPDVRPESAPTTEGPTDDAAIEPASITRVLAPGYPDATRLPKRLPVGDVTVSTRLRCPTEGRAGLIPDGRIWQMTLREIAESEAEDQPGRAAVIVLKDPNDGTVLVLNRDGTVVRRWDMTGFGSDWAIDTVSFCQGTRTASIVP